MKETKKSFIYFSLMGELATEDLYNPENELELLLTFTCRLF